MCECYICMCVCKCDYRIWDAINARWTDTFLCFHLVDYVLRAFVLLLFALLIKSNGKNLFFIETLRYTTLHFRANYLRNCYLPNVIHKFIKMMSIKMIRASRTISTLSKKTCKFTLVVKFKYFNRLNQLCSDKTGISIANIVNWNASNEIWMPNGWKHILSKELILSLYLSSTVSVSILLF